MKKRDYLSKKLILLVTYLIIFFIAGLFINYLIKIQHSQLTIEQREEGYQKILEEKYPEIKGYWSFIPLIFSDGLEWDDITQRDKEPIFRIIKTSKGEEEVSVINGFRVLYKYPNTNYFAKMHIEKSKFEEYERDKSKVISQLNYLAKSIPLENKIYEGYEFFDLNNENFNSSVIGIALIFFPEEQIVTTIYFLNQNSKERKFQTIEEFILLKNSFIKEVIDNRVKNK